jgi:FKBP-type peptidyl-prolyl cis-trans isomerase FkpA
MKKIISLLALVGTLAANAQDGNGFTDAGRGIMYKIISGGNTAPLTYGSFVEFAFKQTYKDSVLASSEDYSNQIAMLDSVNIPVNIYTIFSQSHKGDSIVLKMLADSVYKDPQTGQSLMPPFAQSGQYIFACYKIMEIYTSREAADSAFKALNAIAKVKADEKARQRILIEDKTIQDYLAANNIKAEKTASGVYIETLAAGKGKKVDNNTAVSINYTGKTMAGKVFDSNTDPSFGHTEPYEVKMWEPNVIGGWVEAIATFSLGSKARIFIPSPMGYGPQGNGSDIKPNEILIFDMEVVKMTQRPQAAVKPVKPAALKKKPVPAKKPVKKKK